MNRLLIVFFLLSTFLVGCTKGDGEIGADALPGAVPDILGTYVVNGVDHLNNEYGGHLTITAGKHPGEYKFQWIIVESIQEGIGTLDGNQLLIKWQNIDNPDTTYNGEVIYTITENGELYGKRTVNEQNGEGQETAYPNQ